MSEPQKAAAPTGALDRYFKISERGSSIAAEFRGGLAAFFAMSYIVVLNPSSSVPVPTPPNAPSASPPSPPSPPSLPAS